jgi:hypothetical protein
LKIKSVPVNYLLSEWQGTVHIKENPIPLLEFRNKTTKQLNKEFKLLGVQYTETKEFEKQANKLWPESHATGLDRIRRTIKMFKKEHKA